jgi:hypothetical protein
MSEAVTFGAMRSYRTEKASRSKVLDKRPVRDGRRGSIEHFGRTPPTRLRAQDYVSNNASKRVKLQRAEEIFHFWNPKFHGLDGYTNHRVVGAPIATAYCKPLGTTAIGAQYAQLQGTLTR